MVYEEVILIIIIISQRVRTGAKEHKKRVDVSWVRSRTGFKLTEKGIHQEPKDDASIANEYKASLLLDSKFGCVNIGCLC